MAGAPVVLLCLLLGPEVVSAQVPTPPDSVVSPFVLEQNYPNPFNPETTLRFTLAPELFQDGRPVVVSLQILNLLAQPVAYPVALRHPAGPGVEMRGLEYAQPGRYEAFWDGTDQSGREVASGSYFQMLTVNGRSISKRLTIVK